MKRSIVIMALGLMGAVAAHYAWFELRKPVGAGDGEADLLWMKSELKLTDTQFERIKEIHDASSPKLLALAAEVSRMRAEFEEFERERKNEGRVDFIEFARFVDMRRRIDRECLNSTRSLVQATADVMTPQQRELYFGIVGSTLGNRSGQTD